MTRLENGDCKFHLRQGLGQILAKITYTLCLIYIYRVAIIYQIYIYICCVCVCVCVHVSTCMWNWNIYQIIHDDDLIWKYFTYHWESTGHRWVSLTKDHAAIQISDMSSVVSLDNLLNKQSGRRWFETRQHSCACNIDGMDYTVWKVGCTDTSKLWCVLYAQNFECSYVRSKRCFDFLLEGRVLHRNLSAWNASINAMGNLIIKFLPP